MKKEIYAVYDKVSEMFGHVHAEINEASAVRAFKNSFVDNPNKNDYELYYLGTFTDHNGEVDGIPPKKVCTGFDIVVDNVVDLPNTLKEQAE